MKDYYNILEVNENSGPDSIKKAYKRLAIKWHPDKNNGSKESEEKFKEISEAYQILSDQKQKIIYDNSKNKKNNVDYSDITDDFVNSDFFNSLFKNKKNDNSENSKIKYKQKVGKDLKINVDISLSEIKGNKQKILIFEKTAKCECYSKGEKCYNCNGTGISKTKKDSILGFITKEDKCNSCEGSGYISNCYICGSSKFIKKVVSVKYNVPKNAHEIKNIRLKNIGNEDVGGNGDVYIEFEIDEEQGFSLEENDIHQTVEINIIKAIFGGNIEVDVLNGMVEFNLPKNCLGKMFRLKGHGLNGGNMIIECVVNVPSFESLSNDEKEILFELEKYNNFK